MNDRLDGKVTVGLIDTITFKFVSGKKCVVNVNSDATWSIDGSVMIDAEVVQATIAELQIQGYFDREDAEQ